MSHHTASDFRGVKFWQDVKLIVIGGPYSNWWSCDVVLSM